MKWTIIIPYLLTVLLIILGNYPKRVAKELKELCSAASTALEDDVLSQAELQTIFKEAKDVGQTFAEIAVIIAQKVNR